MSEYYYRQMLRKVEALGYSTEALHHRLRQAVTTGQFLKSFDEGIPAERQKYQNFLRREAKGVTYLTHQIGYRHGRLLDISLDEDRSNRNYRLIYR
ncbi:9908_t:CDS:2 [Funneliformis geosporum]|uniref:9908_t:CDS:1 n=1 Tax=Funneliformis geosporum TaxID=1117311 RepID=A0A9W4SWP7_9GLOM|nr:9908_t:CDS:2 [Funneliformis geosporum]